MNLKQNKGYVGTDVAIAVVILLILIPTIMGLTFNANATKNATNIKAGATNVAVNTIEVAKGIGPGEELTIAEVFLRLGSMYNTEPGENSSELIVSNDKGIYKVNLEITDYSDTVQGAESDIVKTVKVTVTFKAKNQQQSIELSTVIS